MDVKLGDEVASMKGNESLSRLWIGRATHVEMIVDIMG
jgi:hypothetical protein